MDISKGYPLLVLQRRIEGHPTRTEHWYFIVVISKLVGEIHELRGNYDTFTYVSERENNWTKSGSLCGGCLVGFIPSDGLIQFGDVLTTIEVVRGDSSFDCQTWIARALRLLKKEGIVIQEMTEQKLREELGKEKEKDEYGEDLVYDRLHDSLDDLDAHPSP